MSIGPMEQSRRELLSDLASHVTALLREFGLDADVAEQIGDNTANHMAEHWGGQTIYYPNDYIFRLHARDLEIFKRFNGSNLSQLAREYKLSVRSIYKIIERVRRHIQDRTQHRLDF